MTNELIFTGNIFQIISKFLNPIDIINICNIYNINYKKKHIYKIFKESVSNTIDNYFKERLNNDYTRFVECCNNAGAVVYGSFILDLILGKTNKDAYLKIYIGKQNNNIFYEIRNILSRHKNVKFKIDKTRETYKTMVTKTNRDKLKMFHIQVDELKTKKGVKNVINELSTNDYKHFEYSVGKNYFYYNNNKPNICIENAFGIATKTVNFDYMYGKKTQNSINKYCLYIDRGFKIIKNKTQIIIFLQEILNNISHVSISDDWDFDDVVLYSYQYNFISDIIHLYNMNELKKIMCKNLKCPINICNIKHFHTLNNKYNIVNILSDDSVLMDHFSKYKLKAKNEIITRTWQ